jgi:dTDP-4-dehydrorhamnose reductase
MIWLVGRGGMLGTEVGRMLRAAGLDFVATGREVDITSVPAVEGFAGGRDIRWIINCAAYTAVDRAEDEPDACRRLNADGPRNLARWAASNDAALLQVSTDYVFSGEGSVPYREDDPIGPRSVYGTTKAEGEEAVRRLCPRHLIVRTAWLYGAAGPNFVYTMLRLMRTKDKLGVVDDQNGAPTWAADLARLFPEMLRLADGRWGTYHASGEGQCTWYGFARAILDEAVGRGLVGVRPELTPLTTAQYPTKARRPAWSVLSKAKLQSAFGVALPPWRDSLNAFLDSSLDSRFLS